jgi:hypothetical protein
VDLRVHAESSSRGHCDCYGSETSTVWGFVSTPEATVAAYYVQWTVGAVPSHGANFDLIIGAWGDEASANDRVAVALALRYIDANPQLMVIDAKQRPVAASSLVGSALARDDVIGTPLAKKAFDLVDAIWLQDDRITEVTAAQQGDEADVE